VADRYLVPGGDGIFSSTDNWSTTSGGSSGASVPTTGDTAVFDVNSFTESRTNIVISSSILCHITCDNPQPFGFYVTTGGVISLQENLTLYVLNMIDGSFTTNDYSVFLGGGLLTNPSATLNFGTSSINITGADADETVFQIAEGVTADVDECQIIFKAKSSENDWAYFDTSDNTFGSVYISFEPTAELEIDGGSTFALLRILGDAYVYFDGNPRTVTNLTLEGDTEGGLTLTSDYPWTFNVATGTVDALNCTISNSIVTGGATFTALTTNGNVDGGENTGWDFGGSPSLNVTVTDNLTLVDIQEYPISSQEIMDDNLDLVESQGQVWTSGSNSIYDEEPITDNLSYVEDLSNLYTILQSIDENLDLSDIHTINWLEYIAENLDMIDAQSTTWIKNINELLFLYDSIKNGWLVSISEDLTLTDTITTLLGLVIHDYITLIDSQSNNWNGREIISDNVTLFDITEANKRYVDSLSDTIDMTDLSTYVLSLTILEYMGFTELVQGIKSFAVSTSDTLNLADFPDSARSLLISETLSVVDANSVITTFVNSIQSDLGLTDVSSLLRTIGTGVTESLVLTETISNKGTLYSAIYDTLAMNVTVELNGDVYECYVLNTPKFYPSMYSGFEFNSFCVFENRAFGANDTGIFELTGSTDNGATIHSGVILSETDFSAPNQKRFRKGYLSISGITPVMVFETDDGKRQAYTVDTNGKITVSHELKGKSWVLSVADFDTLDSIKLIPIILTK